MLILQEVGTHSEDVLLPSFCYISQDAITQTYCMYALLCITYCICITPIDLEIDLAVYSKMNWRQIVLCGVDVGS